MEASAGAPPRPEEISSRLNQLTLELMTATNRLLDREILQESTNGITDVPQEREVTCPICFEQFGEEHAPRTLRCGHSVCTPCLETILTRTAGDRNCPECRRPLKVTAVAHIPVSYTIMRLARALEATCAAAAAGGGPPPAAPVTTDLKQADILGESNSAVSGLDSIPDSALVPVDEAPPEFVDHEVVVVSDNHPSTSGYIVVGEPAGDTGTGGSGAEHGTTVGSLSTAFEDLRLEAERERLKGLRTFTEAEEERKHAETFRADYYKALLRKMQPE